MKKEWLRIEDGRSNLSFFSLGFVFYMKCLLPLSEWTYEKIGMKKAIIVVIVLFLAIIVDLLITLGDLPVLA